MRSKAVRVAAAAVHSRVRDRGWGLGVVLSLGRALVHCMAVADKCTFRKRDRWQTLYPGLSFAVSLTGARKNPWPCLVIFQVPPRRRLPVLLGFLLSLPLRTILLRAAFCVGCPAKSRVVSFVHFPWPSQIM